MSAYAILRLCSFLFAVSHVASVSVAVQPRARKLLSTPIGTQSVDAKKLPAHAKKTTARVAKADNSLIIDKAPAIDIDVQVGKTISAHKKRSDIIGGMRVWQGTIPGQVEGRVSLVASPDGSVYGNVWQTENGTTKQYTIKPVEGNPGTTTVFESEIVNLPELDIEVKPEQYEADHIVKQRRQTGGQDDGTTFDLMMMYTPAVLAQYGQTTLNNMIASAVADMNLAYANSKINLRANLVYSAVTQYNESGQMGTTLGHLQTNNDGYMDEIHTLRDQYQADFVQLVSTDSDACGLGYVMTGLSTGFAPWAFSVAYHGCLGSLTPAHELGHNMGCNHDRASSGGGTALYPYSYGYRYCSGATIYRTVMSYVCPGVYTPRVPYFSSPLISYNGLPTGISETDTANAADNAKSIGLAAFTFTNFRVSGSTSTPPPPPPPPVTIPAVPTNVAATVLSSTSITFTWSDVADETGYYVYYIPDGGTYYTAISMSANAVSYTATGLKPSTTYTFDMQAYNSAGESDYSQAVRATTMAATPATPAGLAATVLSTSSISLTWSDVAGETSFIVSMSSNGGTTWTEVSVGANVLTYTFTGLTASTAYSFKIRAKNSGGSSADSTVVRATTNGLPPSAPSGLTATVLGTSSIRVSWTDVAGETGYTLYQSADSGSTWTQVSIGSNVITSTRTSLNSNTLYSFKMRSSNTWGSSADSAIVTAKTNPIIPAASPTNLTGVLNIGTSLSVSLSWSYPAGFPITSFQIWRQVGVAASVKVFDALSGAHTYTDTAVSVNNDYTYYVKAVDSVTATSANSDPASVRATVPTPSTPTDVLAEALDSTYIRLSWTDVDGETGYNVYRSVDGGATFTKATVTPLAANTVFFTDGGLKPSTTYMYVVRAANLGGESADSDFASATTDSAPVSLPPAPTGLTATATGVSSITLKWTDVVGEDGYKVYRSRNMATWAELTTFPMPVGTVSYVDAGLSANTLYYYKVLAVNAAGVSADSKVVSALTFAMAAAPVNVAAKLSTTSLSVVVSWTAAAGSPVTSFEVYRAVGTSSTFVRVASSALKSLYSIVDTGVSRSTSYTYYVRALDAKSGTTANSVRVTVTTTACNFDKICSMNLGESCTNCPSDCNNNYVVGDGKCESGKGETCQNSRDCGSFFGLPTKNRYCCGLATNLKFNGAPGVGCSSKCGTQCTTTAVCPIKRKRWVF